MLKSFYIKQEDNIIDMVSTSLYDALIEGFVNFSNFKIYSLYAKNYDVIGKFILNQDNVKTFIFNLNQSVIFELNDNKTLSAYSFKEEFDCVLHKDDGVFLVDYFDLKVKDNNNAFIESCEFETEIEAINDILSYSKESMENAQQEF